MHLTFKGKTALLAGGSCDMALELARLLIRAGLRPVLTYRSPQGLEKISSSLGDDPSEQGYVTAPLNFSDHEALDASLAACGTSPDYLVDFIQGDYETLVSSSDPERATRFIEQNISVRSQWLKKATRLMIRNKFGRLIFVSSAAALRPNPGQGLYAASKLAAEALYRNTALELGAFGITAVSLRPGYVFSGRGKAFIEKNQDLIRRAIPSRQWLSPAEVAQSLFFLLSDEARGFNATELVMDGGLSAGKNLGGLA